jgi:hypothetical protein
MSGEMVDMRQLDDVLFHEDHDYQLQRANQQPQKQYSMEWAIGRFPLGEKSTRFCKNSALQEIPFGHARSSNNWRMLLR